MDNLQYICYYTESDRRFKGIDIFFENIPKEGCAEIRFRYYKTRLMNLFRVDIPKSTDWSAWLNIFHKIESEATAFMQVATQQEGSNNG